MTAADHLNEGQFFHASPRSNRKSIQQHGLDPHAKSLWHDKPGVYVFGGKDEDPEDSQYHADFYGRHVLPGKKPFDVWQVSHPHDRVERRADHGVITEHVLPDKVKRVG
jgi:hypothetical protein